MGVRNDFRALVVHYPFHSGGGGKKRRSGCMRSSVFHRELRRTDEPGDLTELSGVYRPKTGE